MKRIDARAQPNTSKQSDRFARDQAFVMLSLVTRGE
jgi:hypothetical protein